MARRFSNDWRIELTIFSAVAGMLAGIFLSIPLWTADRFFPATPVFSFFPGLPVAINMLLVAVLVIILTLLAARPRKLALLYGAVSLIGILVLLDQQRMQPWVFQYLGMLVLIAVYLRGQIKEGQGEMLNILRFVVASIYFWSGVQKLSIPFVGGIFPWMIAPIADLFPEYFHIYLYALGFLVPIIEIAIGIFLLFPKLRKIGIFLALLMLVFVLWTLGPFGHAWNSAVWPWNIALFSFVLILFTGTNDTGWQNILRIPKLHVGKVALILFGILPLFWFFNLWDSYLSWSLYSGTVSEAKIEMSKSVYLKLPTQVQKVARGQEGAETYTLSIFDWAITEMNVPAYPKRKIFKSAALSVCNLSDGEGGISLHIDPQLAWLNRSTSEKLSCGQLLGLP